MWSVTLPWHWVKEEGNKIAISVIADVKILTHTLRLQKLAAWSEKTLTRTKVAIFGNSCDVEGLLSEQYADSATASRVVVASATFSSTPVATLSLVDSALWHLSYLVVVRTPAGARLVHSEDDEAERQKALSDASETTIGHLKGRI
jgi:hypothetical protein